MWVALGSFLVAACGGAYLTFLIAKGKKIPWSITLLHGILGALGLTLLLVSALNVGAFGAIWVATIILVCAALGGLLNLLIHLRKGRPFLPIALIHGVVAMIGAAVLVYAILSAPAS